MELKIGYFGSLRMQDKPVERFSQVDLLSVASSLFDPLGLLSTFTIQTRNILRNLRKSEDFEWDKNNQENNAEEFESWRKGLAKIKNIEISGSYFSFVPTEVNLNVCRDGSLEGL